MSEAIPLLAVHGWHYQAGQGLWPYSTQLCWWSYCSAIIRARSETVYAGMVYRHLLLWSAWKHTATSFSSTAIPVCHRLLNSCKISYCSLCSAQNLVSWLSVKSLKLLHPDAFITRKMCQKCLQHSLHPLAGSSYLRGLHLREGEGMEGTERRGGKGKARERERGE